MKPTHTEVVLVPTLQETCLPPETNTMFGGVFQIFNQSGPEDL